MNININLLSKTDKSVYLNISIEYKKFMVPYNRKKDQNNNLATNLKKEKLNILETNY